MRPAVKFSAKHIHTYSHPKNAKLEISVKKERMGEWNGELYLVGIEFQIKKTKIF